MHTATSSLYYPSRSAKFGALTARWNFNKSFRPFAPFEVSLAFSDQLKGTEFSKIILLPVTRPTLHCEVKMSQKSSIHSLGRGVQFSIRLLEEIFTICNVLHWTIQPSATWISAIRWWISFPWRLQNITAGHCRRTSYQFLVYFGDNTSRTPVS